MLYVPLYEESAVHNSKEFLYLQCPTEASDFQVRLLSRESFDVPFMAFQHGLYPTHHLMGIPIFPPLAAERRTAGSSFHPAKFYELPRSPAQCFLIGLSWHRNDDPGNRIPHFPSWSWAGWDSIVANTIFSKLWQSSLQQSTVYIERNNSSLAAFPEHHKELPLFLRSLSSGGPIRYLHIEAKVCECHVFKLKSYDCNAQIRVDDTLSLYAQVVLDDIRKDLVGKTLPALLLGDVHDRKPQFTALVIENKGDCFERVGCIDFQSTLFHKSPEGTYWPESSVIEAWLERLPKKRFRLG